MVGYDPPVTEKHTETGCRKAQGGFSSNMYVLDEIVGDEKNCREKGHGKQIPIAV